MTLKLVISIIQFIACLALIVIVMLQSGKSAGLSGALGGGNSDTFMSKNKNKALDARLAKMTKWVAAVFMLLTLVLGFGIIG